MANKKLQSVQVFENLVVPGISTNVNKILVAGKGTITGAAEVTLELRGVLVIATFIPPRGAKPVVIGIPISSVKTLVF